MALIKLLGEGELVTVLPKAQGELPVVPGIATEPWYFHAGVRLRNGTVVDPLRNLVFSSFDEFVEATVGNAPVTKMVGGAILK